MSNKKYRVGGKSKDRKKQESELSPYIRAVKQHQNWKDLPEEEQIEIAKTLLNRDKFQKNVVRGGDILPWIQETNEKLQENQTEIAELKLKLNVERQTVDSLVRALVKNNIISKEHLSEAATEIRKELEEIKKKQIQEEWARTVKKHVEDKKKTDEDFAKLSEEEQFSIMDKYLSEQQMKIRQMVEQKKQELEKEKEELEKQDQENQEKEQELTNA